MNETVIMALPSKVMIWLTQYGNNYLVANPHLLAGLALHIVYVSICNF